MSTIPTVPYADTIYAASYFSERVGSDAWTAATEAARNTALKHATRLIDSCEFVLDKTDEEQDHEFPRNGDEFVPEEVMMATCEVALELIKGSLPEDMLKKAGIASENVGDTSRSYRDGGAMEVLGFSSGLPSVRAAVLLREWIEDPREMRLVRES